MPRVLTAAALAIVLAGAGTARPVAQIVNPSFNFDTGNAAVEVIAPSIVPALLAITTVNDAPIILRHTTLTANAWFDAIAPYHPTAVGVYSRLGRRPAAEATPRNKNVAMFYASYRLLNSLLPQFAPNWRSMMTSVGLDPDDASENLSTAVGIGNAAGRLLVEARERDGMNQLGDEGGVRYTRRPYEDYTGYQPVNTAYQLWNPSRWQPLLGTTGNGTFSVQHFITPQWGRTRAYSFDHPDRYRAPRPRASHILNFAAYKAQADEVIERQANLTDETKMTAELFDNKLSSLGFAAFFIIQARGMDIDQTVHYDFLTNAAAFDGGIATWHEKFRYDAVRPVSAIRFLYRNKELRAWGGPGRGTVDDLPAQEWRSYLSTGNHPEYPSGSACFCAAHAQASRRYLGTDAFGLAIPAPAGSPSIEPGITPRHDLVLGPWNTFTDFENACAASRVDGGVHFQAAVDEGVALCRPIGDRVFEFVDRHIKGQVP